VQDAGLVRRRQSVGHAEQQFDPAAPVVGLVLEPIPQRAAVEPFGDQVLPPVELAGVVDRQDVRMIERGGELRFTLKPAARGFVGDLVREDFDRDGSVEPGVSGAVDGAHSAATSSASRR